MMTDAWIVTSHWTCGDGCCHETSYAIHTDSNEYELSSASYSGALRILKEMGFNHRADKDTDRDV